jgi:ubiquinone/menaquinone biosynthesis C-methylase UbiE
MNRQRQLAGVNSYERCLGFHPTSVLTAQSAWLDLCCGSGQALIDAATGTPDSVTLTGVDLVDFFAPVSGSRPELVTASLLSWTPDRAYDLITCVHGLHYIGDKLGLLFRAASWLTDDGLLVADFDVASVRIAELPTPLAQVLRRAGFAYDARKKIVQRRGRLVTSCAYAYLGADDRDGPNYTGQPAVASYYKA